MASFGYQASHEQFSPRQLLHWVQRAEAAGFEEMASSDHLFPWSRQQGQSGFAWSWMGAALQATSLSCGVVTAPVQRYHPAIIAQACATLAEMFPRRFWVCMGSGEDLNEHITAEPWPNKQGRNERLREAVHVIRRLWAGERVSFYGDWITAEDAQVYTLPEAPLGVVGAAISEETAEFVGSFADALYTISQPPDQLQKVIDAFRRGGGEGKPIHLKVQVACAPTQEQALAEAHEQWRTNVGTGPVHAELRLPEQFENASQYVRPDDMHEAVRISQDPEQHVEWLRRDVDMGFEKIIIHNVGTSQDYFIDFYGKEVLPRLR